MSHNPVCPRCNHHPALQPKSADAGILSFSNPLMLNCPNCHRWWRHISRDGKCGLVGTIKTIGPESFTPCPSQSSLF